MIRNAFRMFWDICVLVKVFFFLKREMLIKVVRNIRAGDFIQRDIPYKNCMI